jgi:hypothetical protein
MRKVAGLTLVFLALLGSVGCQQQSSPELQPSAYQSDDDVYLVFKGFIFKRVTSLLPISVVGEAAFKLQEGTHESIRDITHAEIDHYYIWVCMEDACIPVDPFRYSS